MRNYFYVAMYSVFALFVSSCGNEKIAIDSSSFEKSYTQLQFLKLGSHSNNNLTVTTRGNQKPALTDDLKDQYVVSICMWNEFGRISKNCQGFGLCGFAWKTYFKTLGKALNDSTGDYNYNGFVVKYHDGTLQMLMLLASEPDITEIPSLCIDEDLAGEPLEIDQNDNNGMPIKGCLDEIILKKGIYAYDPMLGYHGGYAVDVEAFYQKQ